MKLVHYSPKSDLKYIDPQNMGESGVPSAESKQGVPDVKRSYWYAEGSQPESLVTSGARSIYRTELTPDQKIYDLYTDPDRIYSKLHQESMGRQVNPGAVTSDEYLQAVKDKGYHGFTNSGHESMKNVVALFHPQEIQAEEPIHPDHHAVAELMTKAEEDPHSLGPHFIFTTENPVGPKNAKGNAQDVADMLRDKGEDVSIVHGHYEHPETSILVKNPKNVDLLHRLAHAYGQENAIESDGFNHKLYFYHGPKAGKYQEGHGTQWSEERPKDFYTALSDKDGNQVFFRHHIDGEKLHEGEHVKKLRKLKFADPWDQAKYDRGGDEELARYTDRTRFPKLHKAEPKVLHPDLANYFESLKGDQIDESARMPHYSFTPKWGKDLVTGAEYESEPNTTITPAAYMEDLYRSYKNSPHHPRALALKYLIHRIENAEQYKKASSEMRDVMDKSFLVHHQQGDAAKKNGGVDANTLRLFARNSKHLASDLVQHRDQLHNFIQKYSGHAIRNVNGEPSVALTRGLRTKEPGRDHALASYSDTQDQVVGQHAHHRWVPLKNVWYSYDTGLKDAASDDYGPEDEFLVSPHNITPAQKTDVQELVPRKHYSLTQPPKDNTALRNQLAADKVKLAASEKPLSKSEDIVNPSPTEHLISFIHPHDLHALKATLVNYGYPVDDEDELLHHLRDAATSQHGLHRINDALNNLDEMRREAYSGGAQQAKAFDKHLKNAKKLDLNRMKQSWTKIIDEKSEGLDKAIHPDDFAKLEQAHHDASGSRFTPKDFNAVEHVTEKRGHDPYVDMMLDPKIVRSQSKNMPEGISPKMIHKIKSNKYMAKPYHNNIPANDVSSVRHNAPGWATLTTKDLFDAAGIGHLAEDVRGGIHNGIPMTVHKFRPGMREVGISVNPNDVSQGDLSKIAVMDFLTNNIDRHTGNIMVDKDMNKPIRPVMAIDHELSFGYGVNPGDRNMSHHEFSDSLGDYVSSGLSNAGAERHPSVGFFHTQTPALKQWWTQNRDNIKKSFLQSLGHVSNPDLKEHMRQNFMQRTDHMDDLVQTVPDSDSMFSKEIGIDVVKPDWAVIKE